jgi:tRNA modification GTPase
MKDSTIAAIATYPAEAAIGLIRISGKDAFKAASDIFTLKKKPFKSLKPNYAALGYIHTGPEKIDEAMLVLFKGPRSYTGEDMAELSCHGSPYILEKVMHLLISKGCTPAGPGEFTKRAFLNGKMDLSEAEAVADLISAKNGPALKLALNQLSGGESGLIKKLRRSLLQLLSLVEAGIDFAHEDIEKTAPQKAAALAEKLLAKVAALAKNADDGLMLKNGIKTVIAGKPNTGKSSLLNAMLNKDRAIVTSAPGTTRDTVEGALSSGGLYFRLIDTAGIRRAKNQAEKHGIKKARAALKSSDAAILVIDGSRKPDRADLAVYTALKSKKLVVAVNKSDLKAAVSPAEAAVFFRLKRATPVLCVSAKTKHGIKSLTNALKNIIMDEKSGGFGGAVVSSLRHKKELLSSAVALRAAVSSLKKGVFEEAAFDLKQAAARLGAITGEISSEAVLDGIFKNFCIGK